MRNRNRTMESLAAALVRALKAQSEAATTLAAAQAAAKKADEAVAAALAAIKADAAARRREREAEKAALRGPHGRADAAARRREREAERAALLAAARGEARGNPADMKSDLFDAANRAAGIPNIRG